MNRRRFLKAVITASVCYAIPVALPIGRTKIIFIRSDDVSSIKKVSGFVPAANYGSIAPISEMEFGSIEGVRMIEDT